jgi:NAD+ synthase (glutamine-hydrolysing)
MFLMNTAILNQTANFQLVEYKGERIAVTICEDLWDEQPTASEFARNRLYQVSPMEELAKLNPHLVVNLSASPFSYNQENWRKDVLITKATEAQVAHCLCEPDGGPG